MITAHKAEHGVRALCRILAETPSAYYRSIQPPRETDAAKGKRTPPPRALGEQERKKVLDVLNSERFCDVAPAEVYTTLLDEGVYHCSERTMYRILDEANENHLRRQSTTRTYARPELLASGPNQLWSWDITKLRTTQKWTYYYLYQIIDVFSRYTVGWMASYRESAQLAEELIKETCAKQGIAREQLTIHADRGSSMRSKTVAELLVDLGVAKTHSRPHVSNDNPYSEAAFKTLKYRPDFPDRFMTIEEARAFCRTFFDWYNNEHRHSGIAMLTPESVHYGTYEQIIEGRHRMVEHAYRNHPERFVRGISKIEQLPEHVWINKPEAVTDKERESSADESPSTEVVV
jgi:putative transposase